MKKLFIGAGALALSVALAASALAQVTPYQSTQASCSILDANSNIFVEPGSCVVPGPVVPSLTPLSYASPTAPAQTETLTETNYSGSFTLTGCSGTVSISGTSPTFTVTPVAAGSCSLTGTGSTGVTVNIPVTVNTAAPPAPVQNGNASRVYVTSGITSVAFSGLPAASGDLQWFVISSGLNAGETAQMASIPAGCVTEDVANNGNTWIGSYVCTSSLVAAPTFTLSNAHTYIGYGVEISGSNNVVDAHSISAAGGTPDKSASVTPTTANDLFLAAYSDNVGNANVTTAPSGFSEVVPTGGYTNGTNWGMRVYSEANPALSALAPSLTWTSTAVNPSAAYLVLKP